MNRKEKWERKKEKKWKYISMWCVDNKKKKEQKQNSLIDTIYSCKRVAVINKYFLIF